MLRALMAAVLVVSLSGCLPSKRDADPQSGTHTRMTLQAASGEGLEEARRIIAARAKAAGLNASVTLDGDRRLVIVAAGEVDRAVLDGLASAGALRFRKVLDATEALESATTDPAPSTSATEVPSRDEVAAKLGPAYAIAQSIAASPDRPDAQALEALKPFAGLTPAEVAALPVELQFRVPAIGCAQLQERPTAMVDERIVSCDSVFANKYLLDRAKVTGADVESTDTMPDVVTGQWVVHLVFAPASHAKWTDLTREAYYNDSGECLPAGLGWEGHCLIAMMLDNRVVSMPQILGVIDGGMTQIAGGFTQRDAGVLAAQIASGEMPTRLDVIDFAVVRR